MNTQSNTRTRSLFDTGPVIDITPVNVSNTTSLVVASPTGVGVATAQQITAISQIVQATNLTVVDDQTVIMFGSERQRAIGSALDKLLSEITKESSPVLFELFSQLKKGIGETNISELETHIKSSQGKAWWHGLLDSVGLSSAAKRLQKANEKIGSMLTSKSKSLLELTKEMESKIQSEVFKLISDTKSLSVLAEEFRTNIREFYLYVEAGKQILAGAKLELETKQAAAQASGDSLKIEEAKIFAQRVDLFENRLLTLETIYAKAPAELEAIRLGQGASYQTLSETANSALEEFNGIKSILVQLAVVHRIQSVQGLNDERKKLLDGLQGHGVNMLAQTAQDAAKAAGENRLTDATKLLDFAKKINTISATVENEKLLNKTRFADARNKLAEVKTLVDGK